MKNIEIILGIILIGGFMIYAWYSYLIEGIKGLFKGKMNLKIRKPPGDNYIQGWYARFWGAAYLFFGLIMTSAILVGINAIFRK